ncbi:uncharacterized protein LOC114750303 [Neltuma alba]|uniref:uncharacterized protein LOC114750303 n=1 Tax=Neltuma alba TaxID=207710 RepID=UPI0010A5353B|nr:uncharacterized protein LOC114750303 [Prosopis alba]
MENCSAFTESLMAEDTKLKDLFDEIRSLTELGNHKDYEYTTRMDHFETHLVEMKTFLAEISRGMLSLNHALAIPMKQPSSDFLMAANLTNGAIRRMMSDYYSCEDLKPILQVIDLKLVQLQEHNNTERYKLLLSDGSHYQ